MQVYPVFDLSASSRQLIRLLRDQSSVTADNNDALPESLLWQTYCELRRRGEKNEADPHFIRSVKRLHRRRSEGTKFLSVQDVSPQEHKLVDDPMLSQLWKAYKRCICRHRTGPASQLLQDIAEHITV